MGSKKAQNIRVAIKTKLKGSEAKWADRSAIKFHFPIIGKCGENVYFSIFCFSVLWKMYISGFVLIYNVCIVAICKVKLWVKIFTWTHIYNLILKMCIFRKTNVSTRPHKNGHITPLMINMFSWNLHHIILDSAHIGLSIHTKNSVFMKNCKWSIFP